MPEVSNLFVCLMGMGVTFFGLITLILLTSAMGRIANRLQPPPSHEPAPAPAAAPDSPDRRELIAAVSACIAEEFGTDVSAIRILSFKKIS